MNTPGAPYPKVLIIALTRVNGSDTFNSSLLLKNLFRNWPKDRIAQIYSGGSNGDEGVWGHYYEIGKEDRRFGRLFFPLKRGEISSSGEISGSERKKPKLNRVIRTFFKKVLLTAGLYELAFSLRISNGMMKFITEFGPDIIFAQGYSLGFTRLPGDIQKRVGKPICFHTSDDWPGYLYKGKCAAWLMRPLVGRAVRNLIARSSVCFGFSPQMCSDYSNEYGKPFHLLMNGDDFLRFERSCLVEREHEGVTRIIYTGNLGNRRYESLLDLCDAVKLLRDNGVPVEVCAYVINLSKDVSRLFQDYDFFSFPRHPAHDELPSCLKAGDILFLPESFNSREARTIQYSISTKAHLYMMSGKPIIVYAHRETGVCRYAESEEWALVIQRRNIVALAKSIQSLRDNEELRLKYQRRAVEVARKNHDIRIINTFFQERLRMVAASAPCDAHPLTRHRGDSSRTEWSETDLLTAPD
ncbi:MAG: glycosyltransferase family protein [Candidatus Latescibacterota bacterium]